MPYKRVSGGLVLIELGAESNRDLRVIDTFMVQQGSLDGVQRNPGEHCTNLPGFSFTSSRLPCCTIKVSITLKSRLLSSFPSSTVVYGNYLINCLSGGLVLIEFGAAGPHPTFDGLVLVEFCAVGLHTLHNLDLF
ncbi:MAG: hypothetical protein ABW124_01700 [Candidatus Thiodiazotropha sp. 6PLUC9]